MLLMIDNYDSFTYNIVHYLKVLGEKVRVKRNDEISVNDIRHMHPSGIILSPGPCTPDEAGISQETVQQLHTQYPMLGICLGHQALAQVLGGKIVRAPQVMHGKLSRIRHNQTGIFKSLPIEFNATRYHSLIVDQATLPDCFEVNAYTLADNVIMGISHRTLPLFGVQFHPEAILTEHGHDLLAQFIAITKTGA